MQKLTPTVQVNIRLPLALAEQLEAVKARTGEDKQSIIIRAIKKELERIGGNS